MEEYNDLLKSTEVWIEKTSCLLANPACYDSSRTLSHRASTLQVGSPGFSPSQRTYRVKRGYQTSSIWAFYDPF
jgi:hypothetical protein